MISLRYAPSGRVVLIIAAIFMVSMVLSKCVPDGVEIFAQTPGGVVDAPMLVVGDVNGDGKYNVGDIVFGIDYIFRGGTAPVPIEDIKHNQVMWAIDSIHSDLYKLKTLTGNHALIDNDWPRETESSFK